MPNLPNYLPPNGLERARYDHGPDLEGASPAARATNLEPRLAGAREWALAAGNAVVAGPELLVAVLRGAGAAALDSLHNACDVTSYVKQLRLITLASGEDREVFNTHSRFTLWSKAKKWLAQTNATDEPTLEKSSFAWIAFPAVGAAALAGAGLVNEITGAKEDGGIGLADVAHLGAAGAALALAGGLMHAGARMVRSVKESAAASPNLTRHVNNFYSHAKLDAASSGAAVVEAVAHMADKGVWAVNLAVVGIAGYQTWRFWPSRAGSHAQDEHNHHAHADCDHVHLIPHEAIDASSALMRKAKAMGSAVLSGMVRNGKEAEPAEYKGRRRFHDERPHFATRRRLQRVLAGGLTLSLAAGTLAGSTGHKELPAEPSAQPTAPAVAQHSRPQVLDAAPKQQKVTDCVIIKRGDSQWKIVEQRIKDATGVHPSASSINTIMRFTAGINKDAFPKPSHITPAKCLQVPVITATSTLYKAITDSKRAQHTQLAKDLATLNAKSSLADVLQERTILQRIEATLMDVAVTQ